MRMIKTNRDLPVMMINQCQLRAIEIVDCDASPVFNYGCHRTDTLQEWWLVPDNGVCWSAVDLNNACLNNLWDLRNLCLTDEHVRDMITRSIAQAQLPRHAATDFAWNFSVPHVDGIGWVLSVICATKPAMEEIYNRHWREPHAGIAAV